MLSSMRGSFRNNSEGPSSRVVLCGEEENIQGVERGWSMLKARNKTVEAGRRSG